VKSLQGPWVLRGDAGLFRELAPRLEQAARARTRWRGFVELGTNAATSAERVQAYLKYGPLQLRPALRHASRALVPGIEIPRLQEFANLAWLRSHGFGAPRPLVAGVLRRLGLPRFQFLATQAIPTARTLAEALARDARAERTVSLELLAREVARLHELGFVHRDLFARNVLVTDESRARTGAGAALRLHFLDAWRGGPQRGLRGPAYDLACILSDGEWLFSPEERRRFERCYASERALDDPDAGALRRSTGRTLARLVRRLSRRGRISAP